MNEKDDVSLPRHDWWQADEHPVLGMTLGPCAWHAVMLQCDDAQAKRRVVYMKRHRSLVVVDSQVDADAVAGLLECVAADEGEKGCPWDAMAGGVMLCMKEPSFVRRFAQQVRDRLAALKLGKVSILTLEVEDLSELKSGGLLQVMFDLREQGLVDHVGLAVEEASGGEWLATRTAARVLMLPYSLANQTAAYRALPLLAEMEKFCVARWPEAEAGDGRAAGFALSQSGKVLPVFDQPLAVETRPMSEADAEEIWQQYQQTHEPPAKLPRSHPPD